MKLSQKYGGLIWTNHALERLKERNLPQDLAYAAFTSPDTSINGKKPQTIEYQKFVDHYKITVIATKNEKGEWIVLSCWIDPPMPGSIDIKKRQAYQEYQKATFWKKIWLTIKQQLGISKF